MTPSPPVLPPPSEAPSPARADLAGRFAPTALILLVLATAATIYTAQRRTSTTYDEIVLIAAGARGYETGDWGLAPDHPPLMQYVYGLPVHLSRPIYADEHLMAPADRPTEAQRYGYSTWFFWRAGNDPEKLASLGRAPAALCAACVVLVAFLYARSIAGPGAAFLAAALTATLPDLLAHGGVAYNDVPLALAYLGCVWAIDSAVRTPTLPSGFGTGLLIGLACGIKTSAIALAVVAAAMLGCEALARPRDRAWLGGILRASLGVLAGTWLALVFVYRGDFALTEWRFAIGTMMRFASLGTRPVYLLGQRLPQGVWYFFPLAFLFKTSVGLHALLAAASIGWARALREGGRKLLNSPARGPVVGLLVFLALLLTSRLNIGFRHALPALPLLCILVAVGIRTVWRTTGTALRTGFVAAAVWAAVHVASYYPHFLGYINEYGPGRDRNFSVLSESSVDWGQGLLELRQVMRERGIPSVFLSYFGSALPEGYGIAYSPLPSVPDLPQQPPLPAPPRWIAISATNLVGLYFAGPNPFTHLCDQVPDHVIAYSIYLYRIPD